MTQPRPTLTSFLKNVIDQTPEWLASSLVLLALILLVFANVLIRPDRVVEGDDLLNFYFWEYFAREQLARSELPLWTPYILSGYPAASNLEVMAFYPPAILLRLLPLNYSFGVGYTFHFWWMALGMYWWMRWNGYRRGGAYVSAIVFVLSGFVVPRVDAGHADVIYSIAWMPWAMGLWQKTLRTRSLAFMILSAGAIGMHFLGGHPATFVFTLILLGLITIFWWADEGRRLGRAELWKRAMLAGGVAGMSVGGVAVQLLPTLELASLSTHAVALLNECGLPLSLTWQDLTSIVFASIPFDTYLPWERNGYFGALALAFAAVAVFHRDDNGAGRFKWFMIGVVVVGLILGFNPRLPFLPDQRLLPPVSSFRMPSRFMLYVCVAGAALAGLGFDALARRAESGKGPSRWPLIAALALAALAAPVDAYYLSQLKFVSSQSDWLIALKVFLLNGALMSAPRYLLAAIALWLWGKPRVARWAMPLAFAIVFADLWLFGRVYILSVREMANPSAVVDGADATRERLVVYPYMFANGSIATHSANAQGYTAIVPAWYSELSADPANACGAVEHVDIPPADSQLLRLLSVKYLVSNGEPLGIQSEPIRVVSDVYVYEVADPGPRAVVVPRAVAASSNQEALSLVRSEGFDPAQMAVIESANSAAPAASEGSGGAASAVITIYESQRVVIEAESAGAGWLILNDTWYPGWHAQVNGEERPIYRANGAFRGVSVPAGRSVVEFTYRNNLFLLGGAISLATCSLALAALAVMRLRRSA